MHGNLVSCHPPLPICSGRFRWLFHSPPDVLVLRLSPSWRLHSLDCRLVWTHCAVVTQRTDFFRCDCEFATRLPVSCASLYPIGHPCSPVTYVSVCIVIPPITRNSDERLRRIARRRSLRALTVCRRCSLRELLVPHRALRRIHIHDMPL